MEESTALWLLGLAHSECEAMRSELDSTYGCRKAMALDLDAARKEVDALRVERMTLRDERDAARAEADALRNEVDRLRADPSIQAMLLTQVAIGDLTAEVDRLRAELDALKAAQTDFPGVTAPAAEPPQTPTP